MFKHNSEILPPIVETVLTCSRQHIALQGHANGLRHVFTNFEHIAAFLIAKELLEPINSIAQCLQGRLQEVYFGFKKVDEVKNNYKKIRKKH